MDVFADVINFEQPPKQSICVSESRLDNRSDLCRVLGVNNDSVDNHLIQSAYELWGSDCFAKLKGDWSCAIYDSRSRKVYLAVDFLSRYGLFYFVNGDKLYFSNSLPKLVSILPERPRLNDKYLLERILFVRPQHPTTPFEGVRYVSPGTFIEFNESGVSTTHRYWNTHHINRIDVRNEGALLEQFMFLYRQAIQRRMLPGQQIASHLSGGLDSGSVSVLAARVLQESGQSLDAFTATELYDSSVLHSGRGNEAKFASITAKAIPNLRHHIIKSEHTSMLTSIQRAFRQTYLIGSGIGNSYWIHEISDEANSNGNDTLLVSQSGNAGISWPGTTFKYRLKFQLNKYAQDIKQFGIQHKSLGVPFESTRLSFNVNRRQLYKKEWLEDFTYADLFKKESGAIDVDPLPWVHPIRMDLFAFRCARIGIFWQSMSLATGINHWDPTADQDLVEFCLGIPEEYYRRNIGRNLVRQAFRGQIPDEVLHRKERGRQSSDWLFRFQKEAREWVEYFEGLQASHPIHQYVHIDKVIYEIEAVRNMKITADSRPEERFNIDVSIILALVEYFEIGH